MAPNSRYMAHGPKYGEPEGLGMFIYLFIRTHIHIHIVYMYIKNEQCIAGGRTATSLILLT